MQTTTTETGPQQHKHEEDYAGFRKGITDSFKAVADDAPLFTTDAANLFDVFLAALPDGSRQHYTCHACRRFVNTYGGLVTIDPDGGTVPVMWDGKADAFFAPAVAALRSAVRSAKVTGVFLSSDPTWGLPVNVSKVPPFQWYHMAVTPPRSRLFRGTQIKNASQAMAEKLEEHGMLCRSFGDFTPEHAAKALALLTSGTFYRSEKCIGVATWLDGLHKARAATKNTRHRDNLVWRAVATAPVGFCHVRSGMIGTLLEDIAADLPVADIQRKFAEKMDPLKYQRPQALPSAGNVAAAEKLVEQLGIARSLERRFARRSDLRAFLWQPAKVAEEAKVAGIFAGLQTKEKHADVKALALPALTMTWSKFARDVLPTATRIECHIPSRGHFFGLVTAQHEDAPPILQWDTEEHRNPVSHYFYNAGSAAYSWGLHTGLVEVDAIVPRPAHWDDRERNKHHEEDALLVLRGAHEVSPHGGLGLFPEILKSALHGARSTIEAFSRGKQLERDTESAAGLSTRSGVTLRVHTATTTQTITIDRWE